MFSLFNQKPERWFEQGKSKNRKIVRNKKVKFHGFLLHSNRVKRRYISILRCDYDENYLGEINNINWKIFLSELQSATQVVTKEKKVRRETKRANANFFSQSLLTQAKGTGKKLALMPATEKAFNLVDGDDKELSTD